MREALPVASAPLPVARPGNRRLRRWRGEGGGMAGPHLQQPSFLLVGAERRELTGEAAQRARRAVPTAGRPVPVWARGGGFLVKPSALSRPCAKVGQREPQQERRAGGAA